MPSSLHYTDRYISPPKKRRPWRMILVILLLVLACIAGYWMAGQNIKASTIFKAKKIKSPYFAYVHRLHHAGLDSMPLGRTWIAVGEAALMDSTMMDLPVQLETFVDAAKPQALSFRFEVTEGELLHILINNRAGDEGQLFVELFEYRGADRLPKVILSEVHLAGEIMHKVREDGIYILRIQPEMLINISYQLSLYRTASLAFPVQGKDRKAIMSFFGAARDGGRRKHKGVDIFATKGTPILAAMDGRVNLRNGGLGGKTVWQRGNGMSLYYAHLDSQYVRSGQRVKTGDILGTVGNTGNARNTPSHLHFGIYLSEKGAVNPLAFIDTNGEKPASQTFNNRKGKWGRVQSTRTSLRKQPTSKAEEVEKIEKGAPLFVKADCGSWLWVSTEDGNNGFIRSNAFTDLHRPIRTQVVSQKQIVHQQADTCSAICQWVQSGEEVGIYAETQDFYVIKQEGQIHWMRKGL